MVLKIDGLQALPTQFNYYYTNELFYDLVLAVRGDCSRPPSSIALSPNSTFLAPRRNSTLVPLLEEGASLHLSREQSTRWENIPEGTNLRASIQSTVLTTSQMGVPDMESSRASDDNRPKCWEKHCHKLLLCQHSEYFREMLIKSWKEADTKSITEEFYSTTLKEIDGKKVLRVELKHVRVSSVKTILDFIYSGQLEFEEENFGFIMEDARKLGFKLVLQLCENYLRREVNPSNFVTLLLCAFHGGHEDVVEKCLKFIKDNVSILQTVSEVKKACEKLPHPVFQRMMTSEVVQESTAETFFEMLINWVDADRKDRLQYMHDLMQPKIRLLSFDFLFNNLAASEVVEMDLPTLKLVNATSRCKKLVNSPSASPGIATHFSSSSSKTNRQFHSQEPPRNFPTQHFQLSQKSFPDSSNVFKTKKLKESVSSTSSQSTNFDGKSSPSSSNVVEAPESQGNSQTR